MCIYLNYRFISKNFQSSIFIHLPNLDNRYANKNPRNVDEIRSRLPRLFIRQRFLTNAT